MLSIIAGRGQSSYQIFRFVPEKPHWSLRDKIYTELHINCSEESVLIVASVLKVRTIFASPTFSITLEMCFLTLRLPDDDSFLELWTHDLWIRGMLSKILISSKINHQDTGEHLLLEVNFLIYWKGLFWHCKCSQRFTLCDLKDLYNCTMSINSKTRKIVLKMCFTKSMP